METVIKINNIIGGNVSYNNGNTIITFITYKKIIKLLKDDKIKIPDFQRPIDSDKVLSITSKIMENIEGDWLIRQGAITLGIINKTSVIYILDGQHRLTAIKQIIDEQIEDIPNNNIQIMLINFNDLFEMKEHFKDINTNSQIEPIYTYFDNEIIKGTIMNIKLWLLDNYSKSFRKMKNKSEKTHNHHIDEFITILTPKIIKQILENDSKTYDDYKHIIGKIMFANLEVQAKLNELNENRTLKQYMSDKDYLKCKEYDFYLAYDNIHFINLIIDENNEIIIDIVNKGNTNIPHKVRKQVWIKRNGNNMVGKCFCCNESLEFDEFHAGHIIPIFKGGLNTISNLEPICSTCNQNMGIQNLNDYKDNITIGLS
jgi:hypothetical protein